MSTEAQYETTRSMRAQVRDWVEAIQAALAAAAHRISSLAMRIADLSWRLSQWYCEFLKDPKSRAQADQLLAWGSNLPGRLGRVVATVASLQALLIVFLDGHATPA